MTPSASTKSPKAPQPATTALKQLPFAFPFLRRAQGESGALSQFTDEHDIYRLPSEPTILRIGPGTVLYQRTPENQFIPGSDSQSNTTAVVQVYSIAELARNKDSTYTEKDVDAISKCKLNWYHVDSANTMGHAIKGWVRELNHPGGGRVTREFAQDWIDFNALPADAHDPAHTIFATVHEWVDYLAGTSITELASRTKGPRFFENDSSWGGYGNRGWI